jgi:hypothetical protein
MVWFKVDDKAHDHRKMRMAGVAAVGLWALAGSWSADNLTDGFIPASVCARWAPEYVELAAKLVEVGLWEVAFCDGEDGWLFHDWKGCNPIRAEVEQKRNEAADRMRHVREQRRANRDARSAEVRANPPRTFDGGSEEVRLTPTRPDPTRKEVLAPTARERDELFEAVCEACGIKITELTPQGRGPLNQAVKQLRTVGASPTQVKIRANRYRLTYPETTLTPSALSKHWAQLNGTKPATAEKVNRGW